MKSIYHEKIIERIVNNIDNQQFNDFTELFDYIMLNRYLSEYYKNNTEKSEHYKDTCKNSIEYLINNLKKFNIPMGVWYGFTGLAYVIRDIYGKCKSLDTIEEFVKKQSLRLIVHGIKRDSLFNGEYDLLNGLTGILNYFLVYKIDEENYIKECLQWMVNLFDNNKIEFSDKLIIRNDFITNPILKKEYKHGYIDLGTAHGMIDFLYVFSLAIKKGITCKNLDLVFNNLLNYYIEMFNKNEWEWPSLIEIENKDRKIVYKTRYSWCYGKLGITRLLYNIANNINDKQLKNNMIDEMKKIDLNYLEKLELICPTFCHGYSGLYHIVNLFYRETEDDYFRKLSDKIEKIIWNMGDAKNKYYFYKHDLNESERKDIYEYERLNSLDGVISILIPYVIKRKNINNDIYSISLFLK